MSSKHIAGNDPPKKRIGELLVESGLITEDDFAEAMLESKKTGTFIGQILIRNGKLTREQLGQALSIQHNTKYVSITKLNIDKILLDILPEEFVREKQVFPISQEGGRLVVAMVDPNDRASIDEITFLTGMRPQVVVTTQMEFHETYQKYLTDRAPNSLIKEISTAQAATVEAETADIRLQSQAELSEQSNPLVKLVNSIIEEAIQRNASDIHIEPRTKKYLIRFRVDGILRSILDVPENMEASFVTRIKVMARMDIAEHRRPQDGRIVVRYQGGEYNLRVSTIPVTDSREKIVIRILRPSKQIADFVEMGFDNEDIAKLEYLYKAPHGIVLICGPTGSGKTTTLYTMLSKINDDLRNISTVEDPVELAIEGLNQSQVNPRADYTFASSMRAMLRQDPDVIMVGEIRDYETLEAAIHAALTGHLVFSTIHSNTTTTTITRMIEMGAASNLISSALVGVVAQRLVRTLCPHCKTQYAATPEEKRVLFPGDENRQHSELILAKGTGCDMCANGGYKGRTGVYEMLIVDREIRQMVSNNHSDLEIEDAAVAAGMRTLGMCGRKKILDGETSLEEMTRVLGFNLGGQ